MRCYQCYFPLQSLDLPCCSVCGCSPLWPLPSAPDPVCYQNALSSALNSVLIDESAISELVSLITLVEGKTCRETWNLLCDETVASEERPVQILSHSDSWAPFIERVERESIGIRILQEVFKTPPEQDACLKGEQFWRELVPLQLSQLSIVQENNTVAASIREVLSNAAKRKRYYFRTLSAVDLVERIADSSRKHNARQRDQLLDSCLERVTDKARSWANQQVLALGIAGTRSLLALLAEWKKQNQLQLQRAQAYQKVLENAAKVSLKGSLTRYTRFSGSILWHLTKKPEPSEVVEQSILLATRAMECAALELSLVFLEKAYLAISGVISLLLQKMIQVCETVNRLNDGLSRIRGFLELDRPANNYDYNALAASAPGVYPSLRATICTSARLEEALLAAAYRLGEHCLGVNYTQPVRNASEHTPLEPLATQ